MRYGVLRRVLLAIATLVPLLIGSMPRQVGAASPPAVTPASCTAVLGTDLHASSGSFQCGWLMVPEDWSAPTGPIIYLAYAQLTPSSAQRAPDPIVYLAGGPGGSGTDMAGYLANGHSGFEPLLANQSWIFVDQRGTGHSRPSLNCPEVSNLSAADLLNDSPPDQQDPTLSATLSCLQRLTSEGIGLSHYTTDESARDVAALRRALGYGQVNLYGSSYGTRLALEVTRQDPGGVRSVILDATDPPEGITWLDGAEDFNRSLQNVFDACANQPSCATTFGDVHASFSDLVAQLDASPRTVTVHDPRTHGTAQVQADGSVFLNMLFDMLYDPGTLALVPATISLLDRGQDQLWDPLLSIEISVVQSVSLGLYYSVECGNEIPQDGQVDTAAITAGVMPEIVSDFNFTQDDLATCQQWPAVPIPASDHAPVTSDVPTLLLVGEFDPVTPPRFGQLVASSLTHATFLEFPGLGHTVLGYQPCPAMIATAFLATPTDAVDASCIQTMRPLLFTSS